MDRQEIFRRYNLLIPSSDEKFLVIGDDLDSYLSAMLFIKHHPATHIIGFYEQYKILHTVPDIHSLLPKTLWIDLDIYHADCQSLGHHILRTTKNDMLNGLHNSCNLNELRKIDSSTFTSKYPLGTIHFLLSLYNETYMPESDNELLFWLADSSYINGQSHRFRNNVGEWLKNFLEQKELQSTFEQIDTIRFEQRMNELYKELRSKGFQQGAGQVTSKHLKLSGFQLQCSFENMKYFASVFNFLSQKTGLPNLMDHMKVETTTKKIIGKRTSQSLKDVTKKENIDLFLEREKVFSYVFPHRDKINYTILLL